MKIFAVVACIVLAVMTFTPIVANARIPALMGVLQYRYFATQDALFTALLTPDSQGGVDTMQWPLTKAQYETAQNNTGIVVETLSQGGENEIALNNNITDGIKMDRRSPTNFTSFRNALNCLVDKAGVIAGPILGGFATPSDTQVPDPLMGDFVDRRVSGANYPWKFNVTHALEILYNGGWYNHAFYATFADLITAYGGGTGPLSTAGGTDHGVVYSGNDPNGQWGGGDPKATANAALANQPLAPLVGFVRSGDARKNLGDFFCNQMKAIGLPFEENYKATLTALRPFVLDAQLYNFATLGYGMGAPPNWWYSEVTPVGIFPGGENPYLIYDSNITKYATASFEDETQAQYLVDEKEVQYILVWESYLIPGFSPATYCAYKTGMLGQVDVLGSGTEIWGSMQQNWITLGGKKTNTIVYTGPKENTPESNTFYLGIYNPPDMINPTFASTVFDSQVSNEIFTYVIGGSPYTIQVGSAITGAATGGDLPWMAYAWKTELIPDPTGGTGKWTNVTIWLRHDITWHDGVPFTIEDVNATIYQSVLYGDAYDYSSMAYAVNASNGFAPYLTRQPNPSDPTGDYTCSILVSSAGWLNLYLPLYEEIPYHIVKWIWPSNITEAQEGLSTDGLHGLWPGQAAVAGNLLAGAPFTLDDLHNKPESTLIGSGPFTYRVGSTSAAQFAPGGGITLDAYPGFFMPIAPGAIALKYTWLNTAPSAQPSGGYFKIGLADLVLLANAYGKTGTPPSTVPISSVPGASGAWNPAADVAAPSGSVGLSDLVTLALHYGWYFGNYSYAAPYPPSEIANGGP